MIALHELHVCIQSKVIDMGVSQNEGSLCGVPTIRLIVYWGPPIWGNYHLGCSRQ